LIVIAATLLPAETGPAGEEPVIQVAILLDTSNSMDGLIDQARSQLWEVVNELLAAKRDGHRPRIELALYEYGNDGLSAASGHVRRVLELTDDLDRVSEALFGLKTNGGQEYCGQVIWDAAHELDWIRGDDALKIIFIAGNEPFSQGTRDYREACKAAISRGIIVNTIHCGDRSSGIETGWRDGALLADGTFMNIDQSLEATHVPSPQDDQIARLDSELNTTYVPYGDAGASGKMRQEAQDSNAAAASMRSQLSRAKFKASDGYSSSEWDLVEAHQKKEVDLAEIDRKDLPEELRSMTPEQLETYVEELGRKRDELRAQIRELTEQRDRFVAEKRAEIAGGDGQRLDEAMIDALQEQAATKGLEMTKKP
jgi:hypothetical protein